MAEFEFDFDRKEGILEEAYEDDEEAQRMVELKHNLPDHRDAVQKKTFTKWVNNRLQKRNIRILDLYEELRDGENLLQLLEVLCGVHLPRERGQLRFHMLQNVQTALEFLESRNIKLVNIRSDDIVDGNTKLTLGLVWIIILHFQISDLDVEVAGKKVEELTPRDALLVWSQKVTQGYPKVDIKDFSSSWRDGFAFNAIIHRYRPDLVDFSKLSKTSPEANVEYAFHVAEKELKLPRLLDVEDLVSSEHPDEKSILTYVASLYEVFPKTPSVQESLHDSEKQLKYEEYCSYAKMLADQIIKVTIRIERQQIPRTIPGIKELILDFNRYRIAEYPDMVTLRHSVKMLHKDLQALYGPMTTWLDFPKDCSPRELEVLWTKLVEIQDSYNKSLRIELTRLEQMSQVAEKIHKEAMLVDASLDDIEDRIKAEERNRDKTDVNTRRKHFTSIEKSLMMFESSIKHMISGSELLVTGHYSRATELKNRVQNINVRWKSIKIQLERLASEMSYETVSTSESKKLKLERPIQPDVADAAEAGPSPMDEETLLSTRKVIKITKRTYKTASGEPIESSTTVSRVTSDETIPQERISRTFVTSSESIPSATSWDSGISPGASPQRRKAIRLQFGLEKGEPGSKADILDAMLLWVRERKNTMEKAGYGLDLPSSEKCLQDHYGQHDMIIAFDEELARVKKFQDEDISLRPKIIELNEEYVVLVAMSVDRMKNLKSLVEFMSEATKELIWMNQREEPEVSRDWARPDIDLADLKLYGEELSYEIREHEPQFNDIIKTGESMIKSKHPAPGPIEAYLSAMKNQWLWIKQLTIAFKEHFRHAQTYHQFFGDASKAEQKMIRLIDDLNNVYDVQAITDRATAEERIARLSVSLLA